MARSPGCDPMFPPGSLGTPRRCKAAGSQSTATHGLRGPAPWPLALFDRGSGLWEKKSLVWSQGMCAVMGEGGLSWSLVWADSQHMDRVAWTMGQEGSDL